MFASMRLDRDKLIFMSLVILDETCWRAQRGPVEPSMPIRLALATLHALGDGDMAMFESFWRSMREAMPVGASNSYQANTLRSNALHSCFHIIARSAGVSLTIDYCRRIAEVRKKQPLRAS